MKRERKSRRPLAPRKLPAECLCCGEAQPWVVNTVAVTSPFRGVDHTIFACVNQCRHCDAISTTPEQFEAISGKVRDAHKAWVAKELKNALKGLGMTIDSFVRKTDLARATVARASCEESLIEANTERLLWHEIDELRRKQIAHIWTTMVANVAEHPFRTIGVKIHTNETQPAVSYAPVMKTTGRSPLPFPFQDTLVEQLRERPAFACA